MGRPVAICAWWVLPEPAAADDPLRLLDDEEVVGRQVPERLLEPGRPDDLDGVHRGRATESEVKAEVVLRIVAGAAHDLVHLAVLPAGDSHASADGRAVRARAQALDQ